MNKKWKRNKGTKKQTHIGFAPTLCQREEMNEYWKCNKVTRKQTHNGNVPFLSHWGKESHPPPLQCLISPPVRVY